MNAENLDRILSPKSVAVIGDGRDGNGLARTLLGNLSAGGFKGPLLAVGQGIPPAAGIETRPAVRDLPRQVDLALIAGPLEAAADRVAECAAMGMAGALIVSADDRGAANGGRRLQAAIREAAGMDFRVIGPGSAGLIAPRAGLNAGFGGPMPAAGRIALLSQSGAIFTAILDLALREGIGFSHAVGLGSMLDVDFADLIDVLGSDPQVSAIVIYVERLQRIRRFMGAARSVSRVKPIIALKAGRNQAQTVAWHTGAAGSHDAVYRAAFQRAGILRVKTFEELFDCAELLAKQPRPVGPGLAIVTNACGPAIMAVDALGDHGLAPVALAPETLDGLDAVLPPGWNRANPVNMPGSATAETYGRVVEVCLAAREIDALLLMFAPVGPADPLDLARCLTTLLAAHRGPVFTVWMGGSRVEAGRHLLNQAGIITFDTPERAARAFADLMHHGRNVEMLQAIPSRITRQLTYDRPRAEAVLARCPDQEHRLAEDAVRALLAAYGIPAAPGGSGGEAHPQGEQAPLEDGCDLFVGVRRDADFGPLVIFGGAGPYAAALEDRAIGFPPLNRLLARRLMEETRVYRLLSAPGDRSAADPARLEEILIRLGQLASDFPQVNTLTIDPLRAGAHRIQAVRVEATVAPSALPAPLHLAISAYPWRYESWTTVKGGVEVFIRPIRPEDAPLLLESFEALSQRSIYLRFFSPIKRLSPAMLVRLTQIDYDREIALVAMQPGPDGERMLGVGRIIATRNPRQAEFSIIVADAWQGQGIGAALLQRCLAIARDHGIEKVWGVVLAENSEMLALGRKLGFQVKRAGGAEYELTIDLTAERRA